MAQQNNINNRSSVFTSDTTIVAGTGITASTGNITASGTFQGSGLTFDGSNVLSTFKDNTSWTPSLQFGGASASLTYGTQNAQYWRLGTLVFIKCRIILTSKGVSTGTATIAGLPVAAASNIALQTKWNLLTYSTMAHARVNSGSSVISLYNSASGGAEVALADTNFANTTELEINGFYFS